MPPVDRSLDRSILKWQESKGAKLEQTRFWQLWSKKLKLLVLVKNSTLSDDVGECCGHVSTCQAGILPLVRLSISAPPSTSLEPPSSILVGVSPPTPVSYTVITDQIYLLACWGCPLKNGLSDSLLQIARHVQSQSVNYLVAMLLGLKYAVCPDYRRWVRIRVRVYTYLLICLCLVCFGGQEEKEKVRCAVIVMDAMKRHRKPSVSQMDLTEPIPASIEKRLEAKGFI